MRTRVALYPVLTANPYTELFSHSIERFGLRVTEYRPGRLLNALGARALHVHWPEHATNSKSIVRRLAKATIFLSEVALLKLTGTRIIWTAHNSSPHERDWLARTTVEVFLRMTDAVVHLSETGRQTVERDHSFLADRPFVIVDHGDTSTPYRAIAVDRSKAREELGVRPGDVVVGTLGRRRGYKALDELDDSVAKIPGLRLVSPRAERQTGSTVAPPSELSLVLAAADLIVLPYKSVLHSGAAWVSLCSGVPVLAPDLGAFRELQERFGDSALRLYDPPLGPSALEAAVGWALGPRVSKPASFMTWTEIGALTSILY